MSTPAADVNSITEFRPYLNAIIHSWLKIMTALGYTLVPLFFVLDIFVIPKEHSDLLPRFAIYRAIVTAFIIAQSIVIHRTKPSNYSFIHGYVFTVSVSMVIVMMTRDLGGFNAPYYAGLNLVIIAANMLMPWHAKHSAINGLLTVGMYVLVNSFFGGPFTWNILINNLYFLFGTVIIVAAINFVKHNLIKKEFQGRQELRLARDALWGEMEIAKRIQTALLPPDHGISGYEIAAVMVPADEVGGDYYDILDFGDKKWITIGDVSGHGVESGLIMMMTQTSVKSMVSNDPMASPAAVLSHVNTVLKENISRLGADRYMTISALSLNGKTMVVAGKHQDIFIYRKKSRHIETVHTHGAWIGILDDITDFLTDQEVALDVGDIILLFTDGITEAENKEGDMFGEERLNDKLNEYANLPVKEIMNNILRDVTVF
ncbi:MAG TPA: SpoIIE family protein phosphatase, partial [Leptospiraceae bacterium]|nr:SpoIIE family protein phosphatase [Leptospiraceae bacterium]